VGLGNVWLQTSADGLVRADQVVGIEAHQTPALTGKPPRWLLDVVLPVTIGSGTRGDWAATVLHRTLIQTTDDPGAAAATLARLLAQLDLVNATGVITTGRAETASSPAGPAGEQLVTASGPVRFRFTPFASPDPGRHTGAEYL
jgi:hypothetical protein